MTDSEEREPMLGLRLGPPPGDFPVSAGWAMVLTLLNALLEMFLGLVLSAGSLALAAVAYLLALVFLTLAVGLARLRRWAWTGTLGWGVLAIAAGAITTLSRQDARFAPILPVIIVLLLLLPATRRAFPRAKTGA